jgi:hypothetical protein
MVGVFSVSQGLVAAAADLQSWICADSREQLANMLPDRQAVRVMCGDATEPWINGERRLDDFIERGLVVHGAKGAAVFAAVDLRAAGGLFPESHPP